MMGHVTTGTTGEAAFAPWNNTTPALSVRKSDRQTSSMIRVQSH